MSATLLESRRQLQVPLTHAEPGPHSDSFEHGEPVLFA
jgi:hypothetical protein